jgi:hypothetical protein
VSYRSVFASDHTGAKIRVNGSLVSRIDEFFAPGTNIDLAVDSTQLDDSARSRFEFLAWSDAGARGHRVIAREKPDTIIARVAVAHRLRTSVQGAATTAIASPVSGDIASGVYLAEGSRVEVQARSQPDAVFVGWTGDTTTSSDTLTLLMQHPFDLTANFVAVQEVVLNGAADALFGSGALSPEQTAYLDAIGNRDGVYDLGDFLAAADRNAIPIAGASEMAARASGGHR